MRVPSIAVLAAAAALAGVTSGCGGNVFTAAGGGDAGAHDSGPGPGDSSTGADGFSAPDSSGGDSAAPWSPVCPATLPATGSPCSMENLQCEYGSAWWSVACDQVVQCEGGSWATFQPSYEPCSAQPGPNSSTCPSSYAAVPQGTPCSTDGLSCNYTEGMCACQLPLGGPVEIDGGTGYWGCLPEQGCPYPRARIGTSCTASQADCTYESCSYGQTCDDGVWQAQQEACAGAGGVGPGQ